MEIEKIVLDIPVYDQSTGFQYIWESNFFIEIKNEGNITTISANKEGLISLANHLLNLAQSNIPIGYHIHLDEYNSLEENSTELILQKVYPK